MSAKQFKINDRVKCIDSKQSYGSLVLGELYTITHINYNGTRVYFDLPPRIDWFASRFVLAGCPCEIKNCLTHRK